MTQQEIDRVWKQLQPLEQKIAAKSVEIQNAMKNGEPAGVIDEQEEEKKRLVERQKYLREDLRTLRAQLTSPAGLLSTKLDEYMETLRICTWIGSLSILSSFQKPPTSVSTHDRVIDRSIAIFHYCGAYKPDLIKDMITGEELPRDMVIAAHIYQQGWSAAFLRHAMGGLKYSDPCNIILTCKEVGERLDKFEICLIPQYDGTIKVKVLKSALLEETGDERYVRFEQSDLTWEQIDGRTLCSKTGKLPAKRICGFHAALAIEDAKDAGWVKESEVEIPAAAWARPRFDAGLLDRFLSAPEAFPLGPEDMRPEDAPAGAAPLSPSCCSSYAAPGSDFDDNDEDNPPTPG